MTKIQQAIEALENAVELAMFSGIPDEEEQYKQALAALRSIPGPATEEEMLLAIQGKQGIDLTEADIGFAKIWLDREIKGFRAAERRIFGEE